MRNPINNSNTPTQYPAVLPNPDRNRALKGKTGIFYAAAVLTLLLAFALNTNTRGSNPLLSSLTKKLRNIPSNPDHRHHQQQRPPCVRWMAPFLSPGGYSSEAWSYITSLQAYTGITPFRLQIDHHGDSPSIGFWLGLPESLRRLARQFHATECNIKHTIVVCHSEPGAWLPPLFETSPCPPTGYDDPMFVIGRTMFETDRLNPEHVSRCNRMDAVWVPSEFHVTSFSRSGVDAGKIVKVVQPVDVEFFDPAKHESLILPIGAPVLGSGSSSVGREFVFLSVFKWEHRKGWDVLLKAYLEEFSKADAVALHLLTNAYHSDWDFASKIKAFVEMSALTEPSNGWAPVYLIDYHIPQSDLPRIYKAADTFVLPSRGEGWGRPVVEAMAMALPVIVTNWSGPTEYMTEENAYPLAVEQMSEIKEGPFKGHLWAEPSVKQLKVLMRRAVNDPAEARRKGRKARSIMIEKFSPQVVAKLVVDQIMSIVNNRSDMMGGFN